MIRRTTACLPLALGTCALHAAAAPSTFTIAQVFSSADGAIQFVQLRESAGATGQQGLAGRTLTVRRGAVIRTFTFPADLPSTATANKAVLIASDGWRAVPSNYPEFRAVVPDYTMPDRFLPAEGGTLTFDGADAFDYPPLPRDGFSAVFRSGSPVRDNAAQNFGGAAASLPVVPVTAVEFYHAGLDHYFVSDLAPDIDALDDGRIAGWARTGKAFKVWPIDMGFLADVCRFYIPPEHGNSHFFSAARAECDAVAGKVGSDPNFSGYVQETSEAFAVALPDAAGKCPANWTPVWRLWNRRADSNHRYTTDAAVKAQMLARGYVAEGYGDDPVAMCSPLQ
ncbi:MAG: hypothetical protein U1F48_06955 [Burkholderiales bacterium]